MKFPPWQRCDHCGRTGHEVAYCKDLARCYNCGSTAHTARQCSIGMDGHAKGHQKGYARYRGRQYSDDTHSNSPAKRRRLNDTEDSQRVSGEQARRSVVIASIPPGCTSKHEFISEIADRYKVDILKAEALVLDSKRSPFQICPRLEVKDREQQKKLIKLAKEGRLAFDCATISAHAYDL